MHLRMSLPLLVAAAALAQPPNPPQPMPGQPPMGAALKQYLNLTDTQVQKMREAGEAARR